MNVEHIERHEREMKQYLLWNFFAHAVEGGIYMAGLTFIARMIVLPPLVKQLGGPEWMVTMAPVLAMVGVGLPSIFVVHHLEMLYWKKPVLMVTGFLQRMPMLLAGLCLIFLADKCPLLTLLVVAFTPFTGGFFMGLTQPAWLELVAKTLPPNRRPAMFSLRLIIASSVGLAAGGIITWVLGKNPSPADFGILHLITFGFLMVSYAIFALIRETNLPPRPKEHSQKFTESIREIPSILKSDPNLRNFILCRSFMRGLFIALPLLSIHALYALDKPKDFLGILVFWNVAGKIAGNLFNAAASGRYGSKPVFVITCGLFIAVFPVAAFTANLYLFYGVFFLAGFCFDAIMVSGTTLCMAIPPRERRLKYLSVINLLSLPAMLLAPIIGAGAKELTGSFTTPALLASLCLAFSLFFMLRTTDPSRLSPGLN